MTDDAGDPPWWPARLLLRAARSGTLATAAGGQPYAALVTPATAPDGSVLMLLSELSEHTRQLRAEPRCALMVQGVPETANPQTAPRLSLTGLAEPEPDPELRRRWLAVHPYAAMYVDFADFALWRLRPQAGLFVAGFARAHRLRRAELTVAAPAEAPILARCNADHADAIDAVARACGMDGPCAMVAADPDGCDLAAGEAVRRVAWPCHADDANAICAALINLARNGRA